MDEAAPEYLILVDEHDTPVGKMEKMEVHRRGLLHRAFSVFIFNREGKLLLQQRAHGKYHSGGLWTNTVCSHPRYGEELQHAVNRRLQEEMGLIAETQFAFSFVYKTDFHNGLTEHEYDHVFIGISDETPRPSADEVSAWKYLSKDEIESELKKNPQQFTEWFKLCIHRVISSGQVVHLLKQN